MVFARASRCAQKQLNCNTKHNFDEWHSIFHSLLCRKKQRQNKAKLFFALRSLLLTVVHKVGKRQQILCDFPFLWVCGGAIHLPPTPNLAQKTTDTIITFPMICDVGKAPHHFPLSQTTMETIVFSMVWGMMGRGGRVTTHLLWKPYMFSLILGFKVAFS